MPARNSFESAGRSYGATRLLADEQDAAVEPLGAERLGGPGAGEAGAHDQHGRRAHAASSSTTVIAAIGHAAAASSTAASLLVPTRSETSPPSVDLEDLRCELGTGAEAAAQRTVDHDPVHHVLLSRNGNGARCGYAVGRVGLVSARHAVAKATAPTAPR